MAMDRAARVRRLGLRQPESVDSEQGPKAKDFTNQRTRRAGEVDEVQRAKNRNKSRVRARVEHVFAVVKPVGFTKVPRASEERHAGVHGLGAGPTFTCAAVICWDRCARKGGNRVDQRRELPKWAAREAKSPKTGHQVCAEIFDGLFSVALICCIATKTLAITP